LSVLQRNNVKEFGVRSGQPMIFVHGYGCDQNMWRLVAPAFYGRYRVILFDHVGAGQSDLSAFSPAKYESLQGYAGDLLEICDELKLRKVILVGHSVSATIGMLAAVERPEIFEKLIMIGPSPRYINEAEYVGGFTAPDIEGLLNFLDTNYLGWSATMAPVIMGNADRPELAEELSNSFCRTDPEIAKHFARVTFTADNRADLPKLKTPTLILQCSQDSIAPQVVGEYVHRHVGGSSLVILKATGHLPHLSAPKETIAAIQEFLQTADSRDANAEVLRR
jgi:sigma-B regulation protein RsbQ